MQLPSLALVGLPALALAGGAIRRHLRRRRARRSAEAREAALSSFRAGVYAECPQLLDERLDDFTRANLLRQWSWSHTLQAYGPAGLIDHYGGNHTYDVVAFFRLFDDNRGGVWCGGAAHALYLLYTAFGFRSWVLNSGVESPNTHVVTLVECRVGAQKTLCVQDPLFNTAIADRDSRRPVDYFDLLERLRRGRHDSLLVGAFTPCGPARNPGLLVTAGEGKGLTPEEVASRCEHVPSRYTLERLPDGSLLFRFPRTLQDFIDNVCHQEDGSPTLHLRWLTEQGHPPRLEYLFLYPGGLAGPDATDLFNRALALTRLPRSD